MQMDRFTWFNAQTALMAVALALTAGCGDDPASAQGDAARAEEITSTRMIEKAIDDLRLGKPADADQAARRALELAPDSAEAMILAGETAYVAGDTDRALEAFNKVIDDKDLPPAIRSAAYVDKAVVEIGLDEKSDKARLDLARALKLDLRNANAWYNMGLYCRNVGHEVAALSHFQTALGCTGLEEGRAAKLRETKIPELKASFEEYKARIPGASTRRPADAEKLFQEASNLASRANSQKANKTAYNTHMANSRKKLKSAYMADPLNHAIVMAYARQLADLKDPEALEIFKQAYRLKPSSQSTYMAAAKYAVSTRNWINATVILSRALSHDFSNVETLKMYILALRNSGKNAEADIYQAYLDELQ